MFITTTSAVGEFTSPFGLRVNIPKGHVTEMPVEQGYWLLGHPEIDVDFESPSEYDRAIQLQELAKRNPLKGVPQPQHLQPNATLQLDGHSTRYPVIVVNPVGLLAENPSEYSFQQPVVNLVFDREMVRQVFNEFQAALQDAPRPEINSPDDLPEDPHPETPVETTPEIETLSESELEKLTNPETPATEDGGTEPVGEEAPAEGSTSEASEPPTEGEEEQSAEPKGKGRGRKTAISDEDI